MLLDESNEPVLYLVAEYPAEREILRAMTDRGEARARIVESRMTGVVGDEVLSPVIELSWPGSPKSRTRDSRGRFTKESE